MSKGRSTTARTIRISDWCLEWFEKEAKEREKTFNEVIRGLLESYVKRMMRVRIEKATAKSEDGLMTIPEIDPEKLKKFKDKWGR